MITRLREIAPGSNINEAISESIEQAKHKGGLVAFHFNGAKVRVARDSNPDLIYRDWSRHMDGCHDGVIGPYPEAVLSAETQENDRRIRAEREQRKKEQAAEYDRQQSEKRRSVEAEIEGEALDLSDAEAWTKIVEINKDSPYSMATVNYARQWMLLMQVRMKSESLAEVAEKASHDADTFGITGFMYGCAVGMASMVWKHGEELRRWHNLRHQIQGEGEAANEKGTVLNPAMLTLRA